MDERTRTSLSKFLSFVLRHEPEAIGIRLDRHGWAAIDRLLLQCHEHGKDISRSMLHEIVRTSPKQRFALSDDGLCIRANQGHSVEVELGYKAAIPPDVLFHGTVAEKIESIRLRGIHRMERQHVHLSPDARTAKVVGQRRGKPVLLRVLASRMHQAGYSFWLSANGVWLTETVPPEYIEFPDV
jgi:putative RNA 2'-phosphotransferase